MACGQAGLGLLFRVTDPGWTVGRRKQDRDSPPASPASRMEEPVQMELDASKALASGSRVPRPPSCMWPWAGFCPLHVLPLFPPGRLLRFRVPHVFRQIQLLLTKD